MIIEILTALISISSLFFSKYLSTQLKEEINLGYKYFQLSKRIILLILFIIMLYFTKLSLQSLIFFLAGFFMSYFIKLRYLYLGILFAISIFISKEILILVSSLIFIYSLIGGAIDKRNPQKIIFDSLMYLVPLIPISILSAPQFLFTKSLVTSNLYLLVAFAAGTLILKD